MTTLEMARQEHSAAQAAVAKAMQDHAREVARVQATETEISRIAEQLADADPDGPGFPRLVAERETARARVEALRARAAAASKIVTDARERLADAEAAEQRAELEHLEGQLRDAEGRITSKAAEYAAALAREIAPLRALLARASELNEALRWKHGTGRDGTPYATDTFGDRQYRTAFPWASTTDPLRTAASLVKP